MIDYIRAILVFLVAVLFGVGLAYLSYAKPHDKPPPRPRETVTIINCSPDIPFGEPVVPGAIAVICKNGYLAYFDTVLKVPRLVAYSLTGDQSFGCIGRYRSFHVEPALPPDQRSNPSDYRNSGFDLGHQAPDQDMSSDINQTWDSYSMVNVAPQLPEFNQQGWADLEQDVRDWAWQRGAIVVYVGSIFLDPNRLTIGLNEVAVPEKFFKIVIDPTINETIAFIMANVPTAKGDMGRFRASIAEVETESGIVFPVPAGVDKTAKPAMWQTDNSGWRQQHRIRCRHNSDILELLYASGGNSIRQSYTAAADR